MHNVVAESRMPQEGTLQGERTIGEIARKYDVSLRTLRFYEDKGLLQPRRHGTTRFYSARDRIRLELIIKGKRLGFTLAEIFELIAARPATEPDSQETDLTIGLGQGQITAQIAHLERQRDDLELAIGELRRAIGRKMEAASATNDPMDAKQVLATALAGEGRPCSGL